MNTKLEFIEMHLYIPEIWYHLIGLVIALIYVMHSLVSYKINLSRFIIFPRDCDLL